MPSILALLNPSAAMIRISMFTDLWTRRGILNISNRTRKKCWLVFTFCRFVWYVSFEAFLLGPGNSQWNYWLGYQNSWCCAIKIGHEINVFSKVFSGFCWPLCLSLTFSRLMDRNLVVAIDPLLPIHFHCDCSVRQMQSMWRSKRSRRLKEYQKLLHSFILINNFVLSTKYSKTKNSRSIQQRHRHSNHRHIICSGRKIW